MDAIACPFCALLCDDIDAQPATQPANWNGLCGKGQQGFLTAQSVVSAAPGASIKSQLADRDKAISEAARILANSKRALISGLATDVDGMRAAIALAQRCGAITDHMNSEKRLRNLLPTQEHGAWLTTFAEVRNRADLIVFVGPEPLASVPRFEQRLLQTDGLFVQQNQRQSILIGAAPPGLPVTHEFAPNDLLEFLGTVLVRAQKAKPRSDTDDSKNADQLLSALKQASYPVFIWDASQFDDDIAELIVTRLFRLLRVLNKEGRASALPIGGHDAEATAEAVHLWRTSFTWRSQFGRDGVHYDPTAYQTQALLDTGEADALVWISTLSPDKTPPQSSGSCPRIVIGHGAMQCDADVFIPVATPGAHHPGNLVRADRVVTVPVNAVWPDTLPSCAQTLKALTRQLADTKHAVPA